MSKIQLLDPLVINKIAAGEVVERPASIVKELVENSIDAGAAQITVEIKQGGASFIRVTDNGNGIPQDEVLLAFERHATSKIHTAEDIQSILTLGFRGEALASIASVAQVEVVTKTKKSLTGALVQIYGGKLEKHEEIGCPEGTTIFVRNLFFNTPARLKFLKSQATETGYVSDIINKIALGHPHIAVKFINNGSVVLHTKGDKNLKNAIYSVYGRETAIKMLPLEHVGDYIHLSGFVAKPELSRNNRNQQTFFINGRYIKSNLLYRAVEDAYKNFIMINKFPVAVLHIQMNPTLVDVNVHPTKLEVRFEQETEIYDEVYQGVRKVLEKALLIPEIEVPKPKQDTLISYLKQPYLNPTVRERAVQIQQPQPKLESEPTPESERTLQVQTKIETQTEIQTEIHKEETLQSQLTDYKYIGQLFATYILIEKDQKMYMIDQHAAHERVYYEQYLKEFKSAAVHTQQLVSPHIVEVTYSEHQFIVNHTPLLQQLGFQIEEFGHCSFAIRGVPLIFGQPVDSNFFIHLIDTLIDQKIKNIYELNSDHLATMACKTAVKAHDYLTEKEIRNLIDQLFALDNPYTCPHGRPVIISLTQYEIEKMFKRIQN